MCPWYRREILHLRDLWGPWTVLLPARADSWTRFPSILFVCLLPFSFSPLSHDGLSSEKATDSSSCSTCGQADSHSPPSPPSYLPERLCWLPARPAAALSAITTSATLDSATPSLIQPPPPQSNPPTFLVHRWMNVSGILVRCAEAQVLFSFFLYYGCLISCEPKGRDKRDDSHCLNADITPMIFLCVN